MKIPNCISDFYYLIGHWFTLIMFVLTFTMCPIMLNVTPDYYMIFAFLTCAGISFVGAACEYKDKFTYPVHVYSALLSAMSGLIWCILCSPIGLVGLLINLLSILDNKRWLLYGELSLFVSVFIGTALLYL